MTSADVLVVLVSESSVKHWCLNMGLGGERRVPTFTLTEVAERAALSLMTVWGSEPLDGGQLAWSVNSPSNRKIEYYQGVHIKQSKKRSNLILEIHCIFGTVPLVSRVVNREII